jgi:hypothetical protein
MTPGAQPTFPSHASYTTWGQRCGRFLATSSNPAGKTLDPQPNHRVRAAVHTAVGHPNRSRPAASVVIDRTHRPYDDNQLIHYLSDPTPKTMWMGVHDPTNGRGALT